MMSICQRQFSDVNQLRISVMDLLSYNLNVTQICFVSYCLFWESTEPFSNVHSNWRRCLVEDKQSIDTKDKEDLYSTSLHLDWNVQCSYMFFHSSFDPNLQFLLKICVSYIRNWTCMGDCRKHCTVLLFVLDLKEGCFGGIKPVPSYLQRIQNS